MILRCFADLVVQQEKFQPPPQPIQFFSFQPRHRVPPQRKFCPPLHRLRFSNPRLPSPAQPGMPAYAVNRSSETSFPNPRIPVRFLALAANPPADSSPTSLLRQFDTAPPTRSLR